MATSRKILTWKDADPLLFIRPKAIYQSMVTGRQLRDKPKDIENHLMVCVVCHITFTVGKEAPCDCSQHTVCKMYGNQIKLGVCNEQNHCANCCTCFKCQKCEKLIVDKQTFDPDTIPTRRYCGLCGVCPKCCQCKPCCLCGVIVGTPCACADKDQIHHPNCCEADALIAKYPSRLLFYNRGPVFHEGTNFQENRCRRFLSVESEVAEFNNRGHVIHVNQVAKKWRAAVVLEGTCPHGGEICTAPASGDKFNEQITDLVAAYEHAKPNTNVRCGMHVHVDGRDFSYEDLVNITALYERVEYALFSMLPPWRRISRFVTPCGHLLWNTVKAGAALTGKINDEKPTETHSTSSGIASRIAMRLYKTNDLSKVKLIHKNQANQHIRYMALNLHSWVYRKTFEFRHWPGTTSLNDMLLWPQLVGTLVEYAKRTPLKSATGPSITGLPKDPLEALLEVLSPSSWCSAQLQHFVRAKIAEWSPDYQTVYDMLILTGSKDWVVPIPKNINDDNIGKAHVGFDIKNGFYTYVSLNYLGWETQWVSCDPLAGRKATINDLICTTENPLAYIYNPKDEVKKKVDVPNVEPEKVEQHELDEINRLTLELLGRPPLQYYYTPPTVPLATYRLIRDNEPYEP